MRSTRRLWQWLAGVGGAGVLLATGGCDLTAQLGSIVSDTVFFLLDNALVHLTN